MDYISQAAKQDAQIFFGAMIDPQLKGRVQSTLIATGLHSQNGRTTAHRAAPATTRRHTLADLLGETFSFPEPAAIPTKNQGAYHVAERLLVTLQIPTQSPTLNFRSLGAPNRNLMRVQQRGRQVRESST
jgi:hypothetical protein